MSTTVKIVKRDKSEIKQKEYLEDVFKKLDNTQYCSALVVCKKEDIAFEDVPIHMKVIGGVLLKNNKTSSTCLFLFDTKDNDVTQRMAGCQFDTVVLLDASEIVTLYAMSRLRNTRVHSRHFTYIDTKNVFCGLDKLFSNNFKEIELDVCLKL